LDVYLEDEQGSVFNIEMQTSDNHRIINGALETEKVPVLPLRTRYYQSLISTDMLLKGMHYWQLRKSYVIFICTFDPFQKGLPMYRFSYRCRENLSLEMGDLTENIFLNATAADKATDKELAAFLSYVNGKAAESSFTKNLDNEVKRIRDSEDWRFHAMYYEAETQFHEWLGEKNAKYQIARNMLDKNIPIAEIAEMTGLTSEEVAKAATETVAVPGKDSSLQQ
jgi:predicted transposase/invertase (TIGR01784 family)